MSPVKHMLSGRERRVSQLVAEVEEARREVEEAGREQSETLVYASKLYHQHQHYLWGAWVYAIGSITNLSEHYEILSEPKLRAQSLSYLWRTQEVAEVRKLRSELAQARELLLTLARTKSVTRKDVAADNEVEQAVGAAAAAAEDVFGADHIVRVESQAETDAELGASHRVTVVVKVEADAQPAALAEARGHFFKLLGKKLAGAVSAKVRVVLELTS